MPKNNFNFLHFGACAVIQNSPTLWAMNSSRTVTRSEYTLARRSYRAARRNLLNDMNAFAFLVQLNSEFRSKLNCWETGLGESFTSAFNSLDTVCHTLSSGRKVWLKRAHASRTLSNFLAS